MLSSFYSISLALSSRFYSVKKFPVVFKIWLFKVWGSHAILMGVILLNRELLKIFIFWTPSTVFKLDTWNLDSSFLIKFRKNSREQIFEFSKYTPFSGHFMHFFGKKGPKTPFFEKNLKFRFLEFFCNLVVKIFVKFHQLYL